MRRRVIVLCLVGLATTGCSLLGLDRFDFPGCDPMTGCSVLNARDGIADDECELWQCDFAGVECVFGPRDRDQDTVLAVGCEVDRVVGTDCDDSNPDISPIDAEVCNGVDDDCNGLIDDSGTTAVLPVVVSGDALTLPASGEPFVSYADAEGGIALVTAIADGAAIGATLPGPAATGPVPFVDSRTLAMATHMDLTRLSDATTAAGCARPIATPIPTPRPCTTAAECMTPTTRCVMLVPVPPAGPPGICERPVVPRRPAPLPGDCTAHYQCSDGVVCNGAETCEPDALAMVDARGCRAPASAACMGGAVCSEAALTCSSIERRSCAPVVVAIAPASPGEWISATVAEIGGCLDGVVMLGHFALNGGLGNPARYPVGTMLSRGPSIRSTSWTGLDTTGACTGASRAAPAPAGAAGISMAALPASPGARRRPQGLVAFLAAPVCRGLDTCAGAACTGAGGCPGDAMCDPGLMRCVSLLGLPAGAIGSVDVEVVGVWLEESTIGTTPIGWLTATGSGVPTALGVSVPDGVRGVSVASYEGADAGYVLAYPTEAGEIAVHVVPALADPSPDCVGAMPAVPCVSTVPPFVTLLTPAATNPPRTTPDLVVPPATLTFTTADATGSVAIAAHLPAGDTTVRLVVAWPDATRVRVGTADLDPSTGVIGGETILATVPSAGARSISVTHVASGMAVRDRTVGGTVVTEDDLGGFVVTWRDDAGTRALRIADVTGDVLGPGPATIGVATSHPRGFVGDAGRLGVVGRDGATVVVFPAVCGP